MNKMTFDNSTNSVNHPIETFCC